MGVYIRISMTQETVELLVTSMIISVIGFVIVSVFKVGFFRRVDMD